MLVLQGCGGRGGGSRVLPPDLLQTPKSLSPASVNVPPMMQTPIQPPSAMTAIRRPRSDIQPLGWTQLPGGAIYVAASPDGSIWVLSSIGNGPDRAIWHYANGTWTNIPGAAMRLSVAPNGTLWVINSAGGIYAYDGSWSTIAGGASDITVGADGSVYVISNQGNGTYGRGIWHYSGGSWTQMPGAAVHIAASWDTGTYPGKIAPGGFWVTNFLGGIYYYNPVSGFNQIPGGVGQVAPTKSGGLFALGYVVNPDGSYPIYYNNLATGAWTQEPGAATSIATDGTYVYVTGAAGGIYRAPVRVIIPATGTPLTGPNYGPCSGCYGGWGPTAVANALNFPVQSGFDGTGFTVAIVMASNVQASDLSQYFTYFQTPSTSRKLTYTLIDYASATPTGDSSQFEATLDVETVAGLAPGANVHLYVIPALSSQYETDAYNQIIADAQSSVVSSSFGGCEHPGASWQNGLSTVFQQGANNGLAFIASSGDQGNECYLGPSNYQVGVNYPASDPNVIGVGGTETYRAQYSLTSTTAWNDSYSTNGQVATGGGVSASFALPSYQQGLGGASAQFRNVPDIAMPASYTAQYLNGSWGQAVGTSWSAPLFAAMLAEVYEYCNAYFSNPVTVPYYVFQAARYNAFLDVTNGNNDYNSSSPYYAAQAGYDNVSGIGVPLGMPFAKTICPNRIPAYRARAPLSAIATTPGPRHPVSADVTPKVRGLVDQGRRSPAQQTRIQIVLRPTATVAGDEQTVIGVLRSSGFTITQTFRNHLVVDAEAPTDTVERLFSTQIHDVIEGRHGVRYTPTTSATIPASLAPYVAGISLDNLVIMASRHE